MLQQFDHLFHTSNICNIANIFCLVRVSDAIVQKIEMQYEYDELELF